MLAGVAAQSGSMRSSLFRRFSRLDYHISPNKQINITVHSAALGESNGEFEFFASPGVTGDRIM